jgi:hypothetical protein
VDEEEEVGAAAPLLVVQPYVTRLDRGHGGFLSVWTRHPQEAFIAMLKLEK